MSKLPGRLHAELLNLEGLTACERGKARHDNPYPSGSDAHAHWAAGWDEASLHSADRQVQDAAPVSWIRRNLLRDHSSTSHGAR